MTYACPICHRTLQPCSQYFSDTTTKFQCREHFPNFLLYVNISNPQEIKAFYIYSRPLNFCNLTRPFSKEYFWKIVDSTNIIAKGEGLLPFPEALTLLNRYQNLLTFS